MLVLNMSLTIGFGSKTKVTNGAFKGFLSSMSPHVSGQGGLVIGAVGTGTNIADIRRSVHVLLIVSLQSPQVREHSIA